MSVFHNLKVEKITRLTDQSVQIDLEIPKKLQKVYAFAAGQYVTFKKELNGEELRRSYSICSAAPAKSGVFKSAKARHISIGVKEVENGRFSRFLNRELKVGDELSTMEPAGKFTLPAKNKEATTFVMVAAGSGITPIMSQAESILVGDDKSVVVLCYGNRSENHVMFADRIKELTQKHGKRFFCYHFLSNAVDLSKKDDVFHGRIQPSTIYKLGEKHAVSENTHYYLCGPGEMIEDVKAYLPIRKVEANKIHVEYFTQAIVAEEPSTGEPTTGFNATIIFEGLEHQLTIPSNKRILDAVLDAGIDAPYSCQSGVCCTCQAKGEFGDFETKDCLSLSDDEIRDGQVLTCVGKLVKDNVTINYDI